MPSRSPDDDELALAHRLLADRYDEPTADVSRFTPGVPVFRVLRPQGAPWVLRIGRSLDRYAAALSTLDRAAYPAARLVVDRDRRPVVDLVAASGESTQGLVVTLVPGGPTTLDRVGWRNLGATLGRLHRCGPAAVAAARNPSPGLPVIERAGMLPAGELGFGLRCLQAVRDQVHDDDRALWQRLVQACADGRSFGAGLTSVFLHGDAHPWNSVQTASGRVAWIDWDSAGPGPAVIDLAFLAVSCDTGGLICPVAAPDPARLEAVLDGYTAEMTLTTADQQALDDALAFRVLVCAAVGFGSLARDGRRPTTNPGVTWSLERWAAVPEIADRMRRRLTA